MSITFGVTTHKYVLVQWTENKYFHLFDQEYDCLFFWVQNWF